MVGTLIHLAVSRGGACVDVLGASSRLQSASSGRSRPGWWAVGCGIALVLHLAMKARPVIPMAYSTRTVMESAPMRANCRCGRKTSPIM